MSTYLVAMLVGDFVCRSGSSDGTAIRVCTTPDKIGQAGFALQAAEQQLAFFNNYFGIKYPFGKLDIIGIPDFAAGAMENAGAITFRERALLVDDATGSVQQRKTVASIVAHEIAHQWFGNLVTMKWWDDIWLNEGFATWAANKPLAVWRPDWKMEMNVAEELQAALGLDTLASTRAIRTKVETPDEINEVFDPIAYEKTGSVLAMIEAYVGPEAFRRGVSSYLKRFSYCERVRRGLLDRDDARHRQAGGSDPEELRRSARRPVAVGRDLEQRRIHRAHADAAALLADAAPPAHPAPQTWTFPVCIKQAIRPAALRGAERARRRHCACRAARRPFVNAFSRGYYLTEYTPSHLTALAQPAAGLTPAERVSLLGDEWRLVRSGRHDIGTYLDLASAWAGDTAPAVIEDIATRVGFVASAIANADEAPAFQRLGHAPLRAGARRRRTAGIGRRLRRHAEPPGRPAGDHGRDGRSGGHAAREGSWPSSTSPIRPRSRRRWSGRCCRSRPPTAMPRCTTATWPSWRRRGRSRRSTTASSTRCRRSRIRRW